MNAAVRHSTNAPPYKRQTWQRKIHSPTLIQNDKNVMKLEAFSGVQDVLSSGERKSDATLFDWHVGETATDFARAFELIGDFCDNELVDLAESFCRHRNNGAITKCPFQK